MFQMLHYIQILEPSKANSNPWPVCMYTFIMHYSKHETITWTQILYKYGMAICYYCKLNVCIKHDDHLPELADH